MPEPVFAPCVVIPVYNHEHAIGAVVSGIRAQGMPILLVDDGCNQACADVLQRLSRMPEVMLVRHERNRGKGAAVVTGLHAAKDRGYTHAVQIDADGQHSVADVSRFVDEARAHREAVICGRPVFDASIPSSRYYGRYLTHGLVWFETLSFELIDTMCGFRVYPLGSTLALLERSHVGARMDFDTEILVRLHWRGVPTRWIATPVRYPIDGVSHYRLFADNVLMTALHARLVLGMLVRLPMLLWRKATRGRARRRARERDANA
jgi:glycosyltransferase involved in cell wall biosynthesis